MTPWARGPAEDGRHARRRISAIRRRSGDRISCFETIEAAKGRGLRTGGSLTAHGMSTALLAAAAVRVVAALLQGGVTLRALGLRRLAQAAARALLAAAAHVLLRLARAALRGAALLPARAAGLALLPAQATGRLIRNATDRGVVAVFDPRLGKANYRWQVVNALPPMRRTRVRADVEAFLREITA